jgi:putative flippase GtrA
MIAVFVATSFGFFLHKYVTFNNGERKYLSQYVKFWVVSTGTLILNSSIVYLFVHFSGLHDLLSKVIATAVTMVWSYIMQRLWVFKKNEPVIVV